jgi:putative tryptophan/tyrosine transport system substrate-binding protein
VIDRRTFLGALAGALVAAPLAAEAQPAAGVHRIGYLAPGFPSTDTNPVQIVVAFRARLAELGYVEGRNLTLEFRFAEGDTERLPGLAAELVRLRPAIIVTAGSIATTTVKRATATIPIVMAASLDPVGEGLVKSLARPGGNVTGVAGITDTEFIAKRLQLAKELMPRLARLALVPAPRPQSSAGRWLRNAETAARSMNLTTQVLDVHDLKRWDQLFLEATRGRADLVCFVEWGPYIAFRKQIAEQALRSRVPTLFGSRAHVEAGGLLSYGTNAVELGRLAAAFVDKILKGAIPADLPVEQPTKFELVINLKTAKALGLTIPPSLLARADEVIQ